MLTQRTETIKKLYFQVYDIELKGKIESPFTIESIIDIIEMLENNNIDIEKELTSEYYKLDGHYIDTNFFMTDKRSLEIREKGKLQGYNLITKSGIMIKIKTSDIICNSGTPMINIIATLPKEKASIIEQIDLHKYNIGYEVSYEDTKNASIADNVIELLTNYTTLDKRAAVKPQEVINIISKKLLQLSNAQNLEKLI